MKLEQRLEQHLENLAEKGALRKLTHRPDLIDFCSNDYLGLARSTSLKQRVDERYQLIDQSGATGSRLLSGHHVLMEEAEEVLCRFHNRKAALLFNSGYDANLSLFGTLGRKSDLILYDSLVHASIHDGMRFSKAESVAFRHNDLAHLSELLEIHIDTKGQIFVAVESVYSMDGDIAPLKAIAECCERYGAALIVDEAHGTGVLGESGKGLVQELGLEDKVFAAVHTFGKAIGGHGAAILGSELLRNYLINFARPFIFSTALPLHAVLHITEAYRMLAEKGESLRLALCENIRIFNDLIKKLSNKYTILASPTPIQAVIIPGNEAVVKVAELLQREGFDVRPIRFPTVAKGTERLRICLHTFNTQKEISDLINLISHSS